MAQAQGALVPLSHTSSQLVAKFNDSLTSLNIIPVA